MTQTHNKQRRLNRCVNTFANQDSFYSLELFKCVNLNILIIVQSYRGCDRRDVSKNPRRFNEETKRIIYSLIITKIMSTLMQEQKRASEK